MAALNLTRTHLVWTAFLLALLVRVVYAFQWQGTPYGAYPLLDADAYDQWAKALAAGDWLRPRAFYQSPLYPTLLGLVYAILGRDLLMVGLLNAALDAGTVALLTAFTAKHFGREAAIVTGLLSLLYRPMIFYVAPVMKEPLVLFLLTLFVVAAFRAWQENRKRDYALAGLLIGLCALTRGNILILAPALMALAIFKWRKAAGKGVLIFLGAACLAISPATIHNAIVSKDFVPINYADGFNLYIGHSPVANGTNAYPPEVSTDPVQEEINVAWIARQDSQADLKPSAVSRYWRERAINLILKDPWRELVLLRNKLEAFWNSAEKFDNYDLPFIAQNFDTLMSWPLVGFWIVSTLAAFAFVPALKEKNKTALFLLVMTGAYLASVLPFYVTDRYRLPVVLFLFPMAGAAVPYAKRLLAKGSKTPLIGACLVALFFAYLGLREDPTHTDLTAFDWGTLATIYANSNQPVEALKALESGLRTSEIEVGPQAYIHGSFAAEALNQNEKATELLAQAAKIFPQNGIVHYNIGRNLAARGALKEAQSSFEKALSLNPSYALNYYALALIHERFGQKSVASDYVRKGLAVDPADARLRDLAGQGVR